MIYFDSAYLAKCYLRETGYQEVRALAEKAGHLFSVAFSKIEVAAVFHRHIREGRMSPAESKEILLQFTQDCADGVVTFLSISPALLDTAQAAFAALPPDVFLRSADCLHLTAARDAGFAEIYSNDRHLLAAAPHFGLQGVNVIPDAG